MSAGDGKALEPLLLPGPARSAAATAMTAELRMGLGLCPDRGEVLARRLLDVGVQAAAAELER